MITPITATELADLMDANSDPQGQWRGADTCEALAKLIDAHGGWKHCDRHFAYSAAKERCPFDHEDLL